MPQSNAAKLERLEQAVAIQYGRLPAPERLARFLTASAADDSDEVRRLVDSCPTVSYTGGELAYNDRIDTTKLMTLSVACQLHHLCGKLEMISIVTDVLDVLLVKHKAASALSWADGWQTARGYSPLPVLPPGEGEADELCAEVTEAASAPVPDRGGGETDGSVSHDGQRSDDAWYEGLDRAEARAERATEILAELLTKITRGTARQLAATWRAWDAFSARRLGVGGDTAVRAFCPTAADQFQAALALYPRVKPDPGTERELTALLEDSWRRQIGDKHHA